MMQAMIREAVSITCNWNTGRLHVVSTIRYADDKAAMANSQQLLDNLNNVYISINEKNQGDVCNSERIK